MKVLIIGVFHNHQPTKDRIDSAEVERAKDALEVLLRQTIGSRQVEFIGEESKHGLETIAKRLAGQQNPRVPWVNIDMTDAEKRAAGIFEALKTRPFDTDYDDAGRLVRQYHRIPEDETREAYFVEKIKKAVRNAKNILVLCGHCHVSPLSERFGRSGNEVEVIDST